VGDSGFTFSGFAVILLRSHAEITLAPQP